MEGTFDSVPVCPGGPSDGSLAISPPGEDIVAGRVSPGRPIKSLMLRAAYSPMFPLSCVAAQISDRRRAAVWDYLTVSFIKSFFLN